MNIFLKFVRPKMTPITSPADQAWFGYLKPKVVFKWRDWLNYVFIFKNILFQKKMPNGFPCI